MKISIPDKAREIVVLSGVVLLFVMGSSMAEEYDPADFEFPDDRVGAFAKSWYASVNSGDESHLNQYLQDDSWRGHLSMVSGLAERVGGFSPVLLSYKTDELIAIHSIENLDGSWVRVTLGLSQDGEITVMGLRKSGSPVDYALRLNLTFDQTQEIVLSVAEEIENNYVTRDQREVISQELLKRLDDGAYNDIRNGDLLAAVLTDDLRAISKDRHLEVIAPSGINGVRLRFGPNEDSRGSETSNGSHGSGSAATDSMDIQSISGKLVNDNIGYIAFERFIDNDRVREKTRTILSSFKDCEAIIIDLTVSGGGDGEAVMNFLSYFFSAPVLLSGSPDILYGPGAAEWTRPNDLSKTLSTVPLYVLTSSNTPSAAEAVVYQLKRNKRATIVGETTAGAGNRVDVFGLAYDFYFVNSIGNPYNTAENSGWEGTGIQPDVKVSSPEAFARTMSLISTR